MSQCLTRNSIRIATTTLPPVESGSGRVQSLACVVCGLVWVNFPNYGTQVLFVAADSDRHGRRLDRVCGDGGLIGAKICGHDKTKNTVGKPYGLMMIS